MDARRYAAPAAFLLAATIAVVVIRSSIDSGSSAPTLPSPVTIRTVPRHPATKPKPPRWWTVKAGDTLASIAARTKVSLATLRRLNPNVSPTALTIGEKIRIG